MGRAVAPQGQQREGIVAAAMKTDPYNAEVVDQRPAKLDAGFRADGTYWPRSFASLNELLADLVRIRLHP
jgi:hypothetical protein